MSPFRKITLIACYGFLYIPLIVLMIGSFRDPHLHTWTLSFYGSLSQDPVLLGVTGNSLLVGVFAAIMATILGTMAAFIIFRYRFMGRKLLNGTILSLIILPDLVLGISLLLAFHLLGIPLGFSTLAIGHICLCLPFVAITINSRLVDMDFKLFEAARDLGATEWIIFWDIIFPQIIPALIGAFLMSFTLSMDDVVISFFLTGPDFQVLPLYIYSLVRLGISPEINALCTIIFVASLILIALSQLSFRKNKLS
jgi:spermidine/putrescine transport system permease protein